MSFSFNWILAFPDTSDTGVMVVEEFYREQITLGTQLIFSYLEYWDKHETYYVFHKDLVKVNRQLGSWNLAGRKKKHVYLT